MSLMAANEESDPSAILNDFWVTLFCMLSLQNYCGMMVMLARFPAVSSRTNGIGSSFSHTLT